jgi:hypothetical protein
MPKPGSLNSWYPVVCYLHLNDVAQPKKVVWGTFN